MRFKDLQAKLNGVLISCILKMLLSTWLLFYCSLFWKCYSFLSLNFSCFQGTQEGSEFAWCLDIEKASSRRLLIGEMNAVHEEMSRMGSVEETIQKTISKLREAQVYRALQVIALDANITWFLRDDFEEEFGSSDATSTLGAEGLAAMEEIISSLRLEPMIKKVLRMLIANISRVDDLLGDLEEETGASGDTSTPRVEDLAVDADDKASK